MVATKAEARRVLGIFAPLPGVETGAGEVGIFCFPEDLVPDRDEAPGTNAGASVGS